MEIPVEKYADRIVDKIPRKIIGGLTAMLIIGYFAEKGVDWKILAMMTVVGLVSVGSHWFLEWKNPSNGAAK